ncbi:MAG: hypothetical protein ACO3GP_09765 [Candidatus Limnocylindrus sp.]
MNEQLLWETDRYGCTVDTLREMIRDFYSPSPVAAAKSLAQCHVNFAACLVDSGRGESNRDEIMHALHRAQWFLANGPQA